ncbi:MAG: epimerase [Moraxellaceae bacterium]|nr:MAG: epimerase [Moraxellaceae bacterium]
MANYLVTGGCGFIGSYLVENLLKDGHSVRVLDDLSTGNRSRIPNNCDLIVGSVCDKDVVRTSMWNIDACFHLAAVPSIHPPVRSLESIHSVNLTGSVNIFDAARKNSTPVVYATSSSVYGDNADMPLSEDSMERPITVYGANKLGTELYARVATLEHGVPTAGVRLFNVYGDRQGFDSPHSGVISQFKDSIRNLKPLTIYGDGQQVRDFVHIDDVIVFLRVALEKIGRVPSVYNVCTGKTVSIKKLAKIMMAISGVQLPIENGPQRKADVRVSVGDPRYAAQILGVTAKQPLIRGLRALLECEVVGTDPPLMSA